MTQLRHTPKPPLAAFVDCLWYFNGGRTTRELALPTGTMELVINLRQDRIQLYSDIEDARGQRFGGAVVCGTHARYFVLDSSPQVSVVGVHFRPGGAAPFLGMPLSELTNRHVALENLWGPEVNLLRERLLAAGSPAALFAELERALLARLLAPPAYHPAVAFALRQFAAAPTVARVEKVADATGYSAKRFIRLFTDGVGLTPKRYCRVLRLQAVVNHLARGGRVEWARVAAASGYCDQSHLIRDFVAMTGLTPAQYQPIHADSPNHVALRD